MKSVLIKNAEDKVKVLIQEIEQALEWPESVGYCISGQDSVAALRGIRDAVDRAKGMPWAKKRKRNA